MKVLFLDIDGVVNCRTTIARSEDGFIGFDPYMVLLVDRIIQATGCEVVLSSTWRLHPDSRSQVERHVCKFIDATPDFVCSLAEGVVRGNEIQDWLDKHPEVTRYAILDDNSDMLDSQLPNFFKTTWEKGLTDEIAARVIEHLNKPL